MMIKRYHEFLNEASANEVENKGSTVAVYDVDGVETILYRYKAKWYEVSYAGGKSHVKEFDHDPQGGEGHSLVHYTSQENLADIKRGGLKPSDRGTMGPGVYFWPVTGDAEAPSGQAAIRIRPEDEYRFDIKMGSGQEGEREACCRMPVPAKYLEVLAAGQWRPL